MYQIYGLKLGMNDTRVRAQNLIHLGDPGEAAREMPRPVPFFLPISGI